MLRLLLPFAIIYIVVAAFWTVLRAAKSWRLGAMSVAIVLVALTPLIIPPGFLSVRVVAAFLSFDAIFRLVDANRRAGEYVTAARFPSYLRFFVPFPVLLVTGEEHRQSRHLTTPLRVASLRTVIGVGLFALLLWLLFALQDNPVLRANFVLDHLLKSLLFGLALEVIGILAPGIERLAGFQTTSPMNRILVSRTPAEFWRRYNTRIHTWLSRNVFRPVGGARRAAVAIGLVFFVSAVFHEVAFDVALSRVDGYQFTFFMLQIPAVLISPRLERFARRGPVARFLTHTSTVAWFGATSFFFARGLGQIFPFFYTAPMPGPLFGEWKF